MSGEPIRLPDALETIAAVCLSDEAANPMPELASVLRRAATRLRSMEEALNIIAACEIEFCDGRPVGHGPPILSAEQMAATAHDCLSGDDQ